MNKPKREELRRIAKQRHIFQMPIQVRQLMGLLDALDEAEDALAEDEHWLRLALVDPGANPPVSWKDRCLEAERKLAELQASLQPQPYDGKFEAIEP